MRTLKKTLALVLVLAMMFSLCIPASAADFTDADEIQYTEAVEVLTAIGVIEGMPDGSFDAKGTLTRAQAAVILTRLLGAEDYAIATEGEFTDVAADHWAAGAISFCVDAGIVAGYGDGKFGPSDPLTGYQWAKMLLCALGYNAESEGMTGAAWQINVAKLAKENGIFAGNDNGDKTAAATREEATLYAFNTLAAYTVKYEGGSSVTVGDIVFTSGGIKVQGTAKNPVTETFMATYFTKLVKATVKAEDNCGIAATMWYIDNKAPAEDDVIGLYDLEAVSATYTAGAKYIDIAKEQGIKNSTKTYDIEVYRNGELKSTMDDVAGSTIYTTYATDVVPNGIVVDVVITDEGVIRLLVNVYYLGVIEKSDVKSDTNKDDVDDRTVTITNAKNDAEYTLTAENTADFEAIYAVAAALKTGEKLYYVIQPEGDTSADNAALLTLNEAATVTGSITATAASYVKIDGETYKLSSVSGLSIGGTGLIYNKNMPVYTYYLDNNGFILGVEEVTSAPVETDYIALLAYEYEAGEPGSLIDAAKAPVAKLKAIDLETGEVKVVDRAIANDKGTYKWVKVDGSYGSAVKEGDYTYTDPKVYEYVVMEDGSYALGDAADADNAISLTKNVAAIGTGLTATSKTEVKVVEWAKDATTGQISATVTTMTGIANFPAKTVSYANAIVDLALDGTVANVLIVTEAAEIAPEYTFGVYVGEGEYDGKYHYNFIVDGAVATYDSKTAVKVDDSALVEGTVYRVDLDATSDAVAAVADANVKSGDVAVLDSTYVKAGDNYIYFAEDCIILDADNEFAAGEISADDEDTIYAYGAVSQTDNLFYATLIVVDNAD